MFRARFARFAQGVTHVSRMFRACFAGVKHGECASDTGRAVARIKGVDGCTQAVLFFLHVVVAFQVTDEQTGGASSSAHRAQGCAHATRAALQTAHTSMDARIGQGHRPTRARAPHCQGMRSNSIPDKENEKGRGLPLPRTLTNSEIDGV